MTVGVISASPSSGVYVYGLRIEGAVWSKESELLVDEQGSKGGAVMRKRGRPGHTRAHACPVLHLKVGLNEEGGAAGMDGGGQGVVAGAGAAAGNGPGQQVVVVPVPMYSTATSPNPARWGDVSTAGISSSFVMMVGLPSAMQTAHWVQRGCALVSDLGELEELHGGGG